MSEKNFYITTPIYYPSGKLHISSALHSHRLMSHSSIKRLMGYDVSLSDGSSASMFRKSAKSGRSWSAPQAYVDGIAVGLRTLAIALDISYDKYPYHDSYHEK